MVEQVEKIMKELETSVKEQDNCVRQAAKTLEVMKSTRDSLYKRVLEYKGESVAESESVSEAKCKWTKNGKQCGYKVTGDYCKRHGGGVP
jgi:hypothetical protein